MGTTRLKNSTPGRDVWTGSTGLGLAAAMSQRRSGGLESAAIRRALSRRRALSQRQAGGVISRERHAWGSGNPGTREPAGGLGTATAGGGYLPRSAGMRARGQRTCETKHRNENKI